MDSAENEEQRFKANITTNNIKHTKKKKQRNKSVWLKK